MTGNEYFHKVANPFVLRKKKKFCGLKTVCVRFRNVCMIPFSSSWCVQAIKRPLRNSQPEKSKELFWCNNNRKKYAFCVEIYLYIYIYHIGPPVFFKLLKPELALLNYSAYIWYNALQIKLYPRLYVFTRIWSLRSDEKLIRFRWRSDRTWYTCRFLCKGRIPQSRREL